MTIFIITLTDSYALVSQDTFVCAKDAAALQSLAGISAGFASDAAEACRESVQGAAFRPRLAPLTYFSKMAVLPHLNAVVGGAGETSALVAWCTMLNMAGYLRDIDGIASVAEEGLKRLVRLGKVDTPLTIFHVGWSTRDRQPRGFIQSAQDGFAPVELQLRGHSMHPPPDLSDPEAPRMVALWDPAAFEGNPEKTETFHVALARNQHRAFQAGKYPNGLGLGGELQTVTISAGGIAVRTTHVFDGFHTDLSELRKSPVSALDRMFIGFQ